MTINVEISLTDKFRMARLAPSSGVREYFREDCGLWTAGIGYASTMTIPEVVDQIRRRGLDASVMSLVGRISA